MRGIVATWYHKVDVPERSRFLRNWRVERQKSLHLPGDVMTEHSLPLRIVNHLQKLLKVQHFIVVLVGEFVDFVYDMWRDIEVVFTTLD